MNDNYLKRIFQEAFRKVAVRYGFIEKHLPFSADYERYISICGDNKEELIKLINPDGKILCLRMDQTIMAVLSEEDKEINKGEPKRIFYLDDVYMLNKSKGILNEFAQYGLEIFQESEVTADSETIAAAFAILKEVGMSKDDFKIEVSNVRFPREVVKSAVPVSEIDNDKLINKLLNLVEEKNKPALRALGDQYDTNILVALVDAFGPFEEAIDFMKKFKLSSKAQEALDELAGYKAMLGLYGIVNLEVDLGATNRFHYYDSFMSRIYSMQTGKIIAAGGRYDYLGSSEMKGCGVSFYEENLMELLELKNSFESYGYELDYALLVQDEFKRESVRLANSLRENGIKTVMVNFEGNFDDGNIPSFAKKAKKIAIANSAGVTVMDQEKGLKYVTTLVKLLSNEGAL